MKAVSLACCARPAANEGRDDDEHARIAAVVAVRGGMPLQFEVLGAVEAPPATLPVPVPDIAFLFLFRLKDDFATAIGFAELEMVIRTV